MRLKKLFYLEFVSVRIEKDKQRATRYGRTPGLEVMGGDSSTNSCKAFNQSKELGTFANFIASKYSLKQLKLC